MPFNTRAEQMAKVAEELPAFRGFSLLETRDAVKEILAQIGRTGPFREYTAHDISHIDALLHTLDWIIPDDTAAIMSPAEWLLVTLGCYFHDLGMIVTLDEFEAREQSGFPQFVEENFREDNLRSLAGLTIEERNAFMYQEFVREHHATRAMQWTSGRHDDRFGVATAPKGEIEDVLRKLDPSFRADLGLICLSHHEDDLHDLDKYRVRYPYGMSPDETANVQYCAILLRTVDLLHISRDRVPPVRFNLINPRDSFSRNEWAKQQAVRAVRPKARRIDDGVVDETLQPVEIEVFATFHDPDPYFALDSYLTYARSQLKKSCDWATLATRREDVKHRFPWIGIDSTGVRAEGFLTSQFRFVLDQEKILDLLTGHTLYNDATVAVRELLQNAIDATRLQTAIEAEADQEATCAPVTIQWHAPARVLTVVDCGTGMTQSEVEENFLKVGSSRYAGEVFRTSYPEFSPISRFGIGVLSAFMIAEQVDVFTRATGDDQVRHLLLRDVHGSYLVRLLDSDHESIPRDLGERGTAVQLTLRPDVDTRRMRAIVESWIVAPEVPVLLEVANGDGSEEPAMAVGGDSVTEVLERSIAALDSPGEVRVQRFKHGAVELAIASRWLPYLRTWSLMFRDRRDQNIPTGTCVEGIRVDPSCPGFGRDPRDEPIASVPMLIANTSGRDAPRTNVARSGLEQGPAQLAYLRSVYECLCECISREQARLRSDEGFSLTRAVAESRIAVSDLLRADPSNRDVFNDVMRSAPLVVVESESVRRVASINELCEGESTYFTVSGTLVTSLEGLLRVAPTDLSLGTLAHTLGIPLTVPDGLLLGDAEYSSMALRLRQDVHEPVRLHGDDVRGQAIIEWGMKGAPVPRWRPAPPHGPRGREIEVYVQRPDADVDIELPEGVQGVRYEGQVYVIAGTSLDDLVQEAESASASVSSQEDLLEARKLRELLDYACQLLVMEPEQAAKATAHDVTRGPNRFDEKRDHPEALNALRSCRILDPRSWSRHNPQDF